MRSQTRRSGPRQEQEVAGVEVDGTFGRLLGLRDGMKVRVLATLWSFLLDVVGTRTNCVVLVGCCIVAR
jgi:hypothetical protein